MKNLYVALFLSIFFSFTLRMIAQPYYVALNGNDDNDGSEGKPFETIEKAISVVQAGEAIYVRGGTYNLINTIAIKESGACDDKLLQHNFTLKNCLAFKNKVKGFDQNNNSGSMILYNCTGHNNLAADFRMIRELAAGKVLVVKNCVDLDGPAEIAAFAEQEKNSWLNPLVVTSESLSDTLGVSIGK
jgi:hypothetical protein